MSTLDSAAAIAASCDAIAQRVISTSANIDVVVKSVNPESYRLQRLLALSGSLARLRDSIDRLKEAVAAATVTSHSVQSALNVAIQPCADATTTIEDQVQKLDAGFDVDTLNVTIVAEYGDHQIANAHLFEILADLMQIAPIDKQEARFADIQGREALHKAVEASAQILEHGDTPLCGSGPSRHASAEAEGKGKEKATDGSGGFFSSFSHSFKAMTSVLRAKPEPIVIALCESAKLGNVAHLKGFVAQNVNINGQNEDGFNALICASRENQTEAVQYLLSAGADISSRDSFAGKRKSALFHAAECGHLDLCEIFLRAGADPRERSTWTSSPAFLEVACADNLDILKLFLDRGADPKVASLNGRSVFIHALRAGKLDQMRLLHKYGAPVDGSDISGTPALHIALGQDRVDIVDFLLQHGANVNARDLSGHTMLDVAVQKSNFDLARFLLGRGANPNTSDYAGRPLIARLIDRATGDEGDVHAALARLVLEKGANPNQTDSWGEPLLTHVMIKGNTALLSAFLEHKVNPNTPFRRNETPLLYTFSEGRFDQARMLLEHGADPNLSNGEGKIPLVEAIAMDRLELVEALLRKGADLQRPGSVKPAALARILKNQEVCRLLVAKGAEPPLPALPVLPALPTRPAAVTAVSSGSVVSGPAAPPAADTEDGDDALPAYTPRTTGL